MLKQLYFEFCCIKADTESEEDNKSRADFETEADTSEPKQDSNQVEEMEAEETDGRNVAETSKLKRDPIVFDLDKENGMYKPKCLCFITTL